MYVCIMLFSLFYIIVNWVSLGFRLLVRQKKKTFDNNTLSMANALFQFCLSKTSVQSNISTAIGKNVMKFGINIQVLQKMIPNDFSDILPFCQALQSVPNFSCTILVHDKQACKLTTRSPSNLQWIFIFPRGWILLILMTPCTFFLAPPSCLLKSYMLCSMGLLPRWQTILVTKNLPVPPEISMTSRPFLLCNPRDKLYIFSSTPGKALGITKLCCSNECCSIYPTFVGCCDHCSWKWFQFPTDTNQIWAGSQIPVVSRDIAKIHSDAKCWLQSVGSKQTE